MASTHFYSLAALFVFHLLLITRHAPSISAFAPIASTSTFKSPHARSCHGHKKSLTPLASSPEDSNNAGVIDLTDDDDDAPLSTMRASSSNRGADDNVRVAAPFLSQGELSDDPNLLSPDFTDGKQSRVIIYIILTLVPILFLVPLMIGSRDLIPLDALPPVEMTN